MPWIPIDTLTLQRREQARPFQPLNLSPWFTPRSVRQQPEGKGRQPRRRWRDYDGSNAKLASEHVGGVAGVGTEARSRRE